MIDLVKSLPVHITDATMRAMLTVGSAMIQMEMIFDHRLDERRLARAADLLLDAEPVVGCRMVERGWRMRWMRLPEAERAKAYAELDAFTYEQFKLVEIDAFDEGPRVLVRLFRDKDGDRVLVKFDHHIGDAGGLKQVVETLAKLYRSLEGKPDFYPVPNLGGDRGVGQLFRVLPISSWPTILLEYLRFARKSLVPAQQFPLADGNDGPVGYVVRHFDLHRIRAMQEYGRRHKATLNDVFVTAFLRTIRHISEWD
ncbi:hypothetical protein KDL45_16815, partial [bacterium]|nr:hypothetical protein [bacterium]